MTTADKLEVLRRSPPFEMLSEAELHVLSSRLREANRRLAART